MTRPTVPQLLLAVDYARYSTDTQDSIEDQQSMNDECAELIPAEIVKRFSDAATSRSIQDRKGLVALLDYIQQHPEIEALIVPALDRLIGDLGQHTQVFRILARHNIRLFVEEEELDYTDDEQLAEAERAALASADEVRKARKRTRRGLRQKNKKGIFTTRPPFGLRMKPLLDLNGNELPPGVQLLNESGRPVRSGAIDKDVAVVGGKTNFEWLEWIFVEMAGGTKVWKIASTLTDAGVLTKNGSTHWNTQSLNRIIRNRTYLGERTWGTMKTVHGYEGKKQVRREVDDREIVRKPTNLGPVINAELWMLANEAISKRNFGWKTEHRRNAPRVLDGLVYCGRCGMKMHAKRDRKKLANGEQVRTWRYYCTGQGRAALGHKRKMKNGEEREYCRTSHSMSEKRLLLSLEGKTAPMTPKDAEVSWLMVPINSGEADERATLQDQIETAQAALDRIEAAYNRGRYSLDKLETMSVPFEREIAEAQARLAEVENEAPINTEAQEAPAEVRMRAEDAARMFATVSLMDVDDDLKLDEVVAAREKLQQIVRRRVARIEVDSPGYRILLLTQPLRRDSSSALQST